MFPNISSRFSQGHSRSSSEINSSPNRKRNGISLYPPVEKNTTQNVEAKKRKIDETPDFYSELERERFESKKRKLDEEYYVSNRGISYYGDDEEVSYMPDELFDPFWESFTNKQSLQNNDDDLPVFYNENPYYSTSGDFSYTNYSNEYLTSFSPYDFSPGYPQEYIEPEEYPEPFWSKEQHLFWEHDDWYQYQYPYGVEYWQPDLYDNPFDLSTEYTPWSIIPYEEDENTMNFESFSLDTQEQIEAAREAAIGLVKDSEDTLELAEQLEADQFQERYGLRQLELVDLGTDNAHLFGKINPEFNIDIKKLEMRGASSKGNAKAQWQGYNLMLGSEGPYPVGIKMHAAKLDLKTMPGSIAKADTEHDEWMDQTPGRSKVRGSFDGGSRQYIRGHLLNDNLGGPAKALNLFPITLAANNQHKTNAEEYIKDGVRNGYTYEYKVEIKDIATNAVTSPNNNRTYQSIDCNLYFHFGRLNAQGKIAPGTEHKGSITSKFATTPEVKFWDEKTSGYKTRDKNIEFGKDFKEGKYPMPNRKDNTKVGAKDSGGGESQGTTGTLRDPEKSNYSKYFDYKSTFNNTTPYLTDVNFPYSFGLTTPNTTPNTTTPNTTSTTPTTTTTVPTTQQPVTGQPPLTGSGGSNPPITITTVPVSNTGGTKSKSGSSTAQSINKTNPSGKISLRRSKAFKILARFDGSNKNGIVKGWKKADILNWQKDLNDEKVTHWVDVIRLAIANNLDKKIAQKIFAADGPGRKNTTVNGKP